jgi:hypothetical protein
MTLNRFRDLLLLPIALVVVVLEDVVWAGLILLLRGLNALPPVRRLSAWLGGLPGWVALPLFLVLEVLGRIGEFWAFALLVQGHVTAGVLVYLGVRVVSTLAAVFVYQACAPALLHYAWFAATVAWLGRVKHWAIERIAPWRLWVRAAIGRTRSRLAWRLAALRRAYAVSRFRNGRD